MAKKNIYVVGYGIDPVTKEPVIGKQFKSWEECKPYTQAKGAKYKGFYTQEEADAWMEKVKESIFNNNGGNKPPVVTGYSSEGDMSDPEHYNPSMMTSIDRKFIFACNSRGYDPFKVMEMLKIMFTNNISLADQYLSVTHMPTEDDIDLELPFR